MTRAGRIVVGVVLAAVVVWLLFTVVFPWVDRTFVNDPVLGGQAAAWRLLAVA